MNIKTSGLLLLCLFLSQVYSNSDISNQIKRVNDEVSNINMEIEENRNITTFNIKYSGIFYESGSVNINFYSTYKAEEKSFSLICVKFLIPKEIYSNKYYYYFNKDEKLIKFIKETLHRPDNPPKQAIIFDENGQYLWSNYKDDFPIKTEVLKSIFKEFSKELYILTIEHAKLM